MTTNKIGSKLTESLNPKVRELIRANRILIPVIIALGPKLTKKIRREHLEYLLANRAMIPKVIKAGGIFAWKLIETMDKIEKSHIPFILLCDDD